MTLDRSKIITMLVNCRTQIMHGIQFKTLHCLKCHSIIADGKLEVIVKGKPEGSNPVRLVCRNCKTENWICQ